MPGGFFVNIKAIDYVIKLSGRQVCNNTFLQCIKWALLTKDMKNNDTTKSKRLLHKIVNILLY